MPPAADEKCRFSKSTGMMVKIEVTLQRSIKQVSMVSQLWHHLSRWMFNDVYGWGTSDCGDLDPRV